MQRRSFLVIAGVERDPLPHVVAMRVVRPLDARVQRPGLVGELLGENLVRLVGHGLRVAMIVGHDETRRRKGICHGAARRVDGAPEPVDRRSVERRQASRLGPHVRRLVPGAAQNPALVARRVPDPLAHVAGSVVRAEGAHAGVTAHPRRSLVREVALPHHCKRDVGRRCGLRPVSNRRQRLASKPGVRGRLEPAHPADRKIVLTGRIVAKLPRGRSRPAGPIDELAHSLFPGQRRPCARQRQRKIGPVPLVPVAACVEEFLVLAVRDFVPVDEIRRDSDERRRKAADRHDAAARRHIGHARRLGSLRHERDGRNSLVEQIGQQRTGIPRDQHQRFSRGVLDTPLKEALRQPHALEGRRPGTQPFAVVLFVLAKEHFGIGWRRTQRHVRRDRRPQRLKACVVRHESFRLFGDRECRRILVQTRKARGLGYQFLASSPDDWHLSSIPRDLPPRQGSGRPLCPIARSATGGATPRE